jgi:hypothetical protein
VLDAKRRLAVRSCRSRHHRSPSSNAQPLPGRSSGVGLGLLVFEAGLEHAPSADKLSVCCCDGSVKGCQVRRAGRAGGAGKATRSVTTAPASQRRPKAACWSAWSDLERPTRRSSDSPQDEAGEAYFLRLVHRDGGGGDEGQLRAGHARVGKVSRANLRAGAALVPL